MPPTAADIQQLIEDANKLIGSLVVLIETNRPQSVQTVLYIATRIFLQILVAVLEYIRDWLIALENIQAIVGTDFEGWYPSQFLALNQMQEIDSLLQTCNPTDLQCLVNLANTNPQTLLPVEHLIHDQWLSEKFQNIVDTLQSNPTAVIDTLLIDYRTAVQNAYGVTFSKSGSNAFDWGLVSVRFAHLGFEATATAFEGWAENYATQQNITVTVNRFDLFRRIMGNMQFTNTDTIRTNFAFSNQGQVTINQRPKFINYWVYNDAEGNTVYDPQVLYPGDTSAPLPSLYNPPDNGTVKSFPQFDDNTYTLGRNEAGMVSADPRRQAIMTPNNLIHELAHSFSRFAGFGFQKIGSMEQAMQDESLPTTREGMGPSYLRPTALFYEHARVVDNNGIAEFDTAPLGNLEPSGFAPAGYLLYDIFQTKYALWDSAYNLYGNNARIDTLAHNLETTKVETVADALLNWVRATFDTSSDGLAWQQFFDTWAGIFIRNAVIRHIGILPYYQSRELIPLNPIASGTPSGVEGNVRLYPLVDDKTLIGDESNIPGNVDIYGRWNTLPGDGSLYWLLILDNGGRLVWVASALINHDPTSVENKNDIVDTIPFLPDRTFESNDFFTIVGDYTS